MLLTLKPHQVKTVEYGLKNPYSIFALGMRTGKSVVTLDLHEKLEAKTLIICPAYLSLNWKNEIIKCLGPKTKFLIITKGKEIPKSIPDVDIIVISYALAQKAEHLFAWAKIVALDEAHHLKSTQAKRTQFIHKAVFENSVKHLYCLTGTPIRNRVKEYYSLIALMNYDPRVNKSDFLNKYTNEIDFANRFSFPRTYQLNIGYRVVTITNWTGIRNEEELKGYLKGKYIRFSTEDVIPANSVDYADVLVSETEDEGLLEEFKKYFEEVKLRASIESSFKLAAAVKKVPFTINYVEDILEEGHQVVIFSDQVEPAEKIADHFKTTAISGKIPQAVRQRIKDKFVSGESRVLVATIKSYSEGVDLSVANHLVFNDLPFVPGELNQAEMRVQGYNQKKPVTIHRILGSPQDKTILKMLTTKSEVIKAVT